MRYKADSRRSRICTEYDGMNFNPESIKKEFPQSGLFYNEATKVQQNLGMIF